MGRTWTATPKMMHQAGRSEQKFGAAAGWWAHVVLACASRPYSVRRDAMPGCLALVVICRCLSMFDLRRSTYGAKPAHSFFCLFSLGLVWRVRAWYFFFAVMITSHVASYTAVAISTYLALKSFKSSPSPAFSDLYSPPKSPDRARSPKYLYAINL